MVLPSDHWCSSRYFTKNLDNQGKTIVINDYDAAFREDSELSAVVSKIGELMIKRDFPLKDYTQESRAIQNRQAENEATLSTNGSVLMETPLDILRRTVKYDIELRIDWTVNKEAKGHSVSFTLEALDTYTNKRIAVSSGTGKAGTDIVPRMIENAIVANMNQFSNQLVSYFSDIQKNGREITFIVQLWDSADYTLDDDFGDNMLLDVIQDWLQENTVNGAFNLTDNTENRAMFEQVRIPFLNDKGRDMDARSFIVQLRRYLSKPPYSLESKILNRGLGEVILVIGEK